MFLMPLQCHFSIYFTFYSESTEPYGDNYFNENYAKQKNGIADDFSSMIEPHWTHMPVKYFIKNEKECGEYESRIIQNAWCHPTI